jgi:hypothetical protein
LVRGWEFLVPVTLAPARRSTQNTLLCPVGELPEPMLRAAGDRRECASPPHRPTITPRERGLCRHFEPSAERQIGIPK